MPRITRVYTRTGDDGTTGLGSKRRVSKDDARVQAYGTVDELNSCIGVALAQELAPRLVSELETIQSELFRLGADLCVPEEEKQAAKIPVMTEAHIAKLERLIDELTAVVGPLENFILPGGTAGAAALHLARTICRRAERKVVALARHEPPGPFVIKYLNRLSDALFVMARYENHEKGVVEPLWDTSV